MHLVSPECPSVNRLSPSGENLLVNKKTGKLAWEDNSVEDRILHGQWSPPTVGTIGGVGQGVLGPGGQGGGQGVGRR